ncbi:hypothetical protein [Azospirillum brasilense]|nr:hypothetical protein [Azospirillum brasilense]
MHRGCSARTGASHQGEVENLRTMIGQPMAKRDFFRKASGR